MKRRILRILALLLGLLLLLPGCNQEEQPDVIPDSGAWKDIPQLNFGTLEYEKLSKLPWDSGRADATGNYRIAETADGLFLLVGLQQILYFADKTSLFGNMESDAINRAVCLACEYIEKHIYDKIVIRDVSSAISTPSLVAMYCK